MSIASSPERTSRAGTRADGRTPRRTASRVWVAAVPILWALGSCTNGPSSGPSGSGGAAAPGTGGSGGGPTATGGASMPGSGGAPSGGAGSGGATGSGGNASGSGGVGSGGAGTGGQPSGSGGSAGRGNGGSDGAATGGRGGSAGRAGTGGSGDGAGGGGGNATGTGCDWTNPDGRTVLFDGTSLSAWQNANTGGTAQWRVVDGTMEVVPMNSTNIQTAMKFEDLCLHLEYQTPMYAASVTGQSRGNSGIYFKRAFEMQVLDTAGQPPAIDGCGAIYSVSPPLVVACNPQLVWNTYEIEFRASQWDASGRKTKNPVFVEARLNGQVVQRNVELKVAMTTAGQPDAAGPAPLVLQDHGNPVRFRNIWIRVPR